MNRAAGDGAGRLTVAICSGAVVLAAACRDAPAPWEPEPREPPAAVRQLTFDLRDDRAPAWSADGASIFYARGDVTSLFGDVPTLLEIPAEGGAARAVFPDLQDEDGGSGRAFTTPAVDAISGRLAFQHRIRLAPAVGCGLGVLSWLCAGSGHPVPPLLELIDPDGTDPPPPGPVLDELALRIRAPDASGPIDDTPYLSVPIPGRTEDPSAENPPLFDPLQGRVVVEYFPAHSLFATDGTLFFRPSWSPNGSAVVFSDGLELRIWAPGEAASARVPGTTDGVSPAWSPDGAWIAFVRLGRTGAETDICGSFLVIPNDRYFPSCVQETTDYGLGAATVELVRPDGSETRVIGPGLDPAWTPDGRHLYLVRGGQVWWIPLEGDEAEQAVPDTDTGREPAVSPDGSELAISRLSSGGSPLCPDARPGSSRREGPGSDPRPFSLSRRRRGQPSSSPSVLFPNW
jgi:hypothetical protein